MAKSIYILVILSVLNLWGQNTRPLVQVSGLVVRGDSLYGIPDVHVFSPKSGRGSITSVVGYFSLPTFAGDSLIIASAGFKRKYFQVPDTAKDRISVIIELTADTLVLPVVEIFPWPTEQLFKEAFLSLELNDRDMNNMRSNLNDQVMKRMLYSTSASSSENHRFYMQRQMSASDTRNNMVSPGLVFLNPFAWHKFIQDVRKTRLKSTMQETQYDDEE